MTLKSSADSGSNPNTLDDLVLKWAHDGPEMELEVTLARTDANGTVGPFRVLASDHLFRVWAGDLKGLWPHPELNASYFVRLAFQGKSRVQRFGPHEVRVALRVMFFYEDGRLTVASLADERNRVTHDFTAKCVAWPRSSGAASRPESLEVRAEGGKGVGEFPRGFIVDAVTIKCAYLGQYPQELVRYRNLHVG